MQNKGNVHFIAIVDQVVFFRSGIVDLRLGSAYIHGVSGHAKIGPETG